MQEGKMKLSVKYMVSIRCKSVLESELKRLGIKHGAIWLGGVEVEENIPKEKIRLLSERLLNSGLELLEDKNDLLVEKTKQVIAEMVLSAKYYPKNKVSDYISEELNMDYSHVSRIFSETTGISIEQFLINYKIQRAMELICYQNLSLSQISFELNYSSAAHFSGQFKKVTGLTPSLFRNNGA